MSEAWVELWGKKIGVVSWNDAKEAAEFEYTPEFRKSGIQVSPFTMPLSDRIYAFPKLHPETFYGLPGLLADSLPDKFGNALIDQWLVREGIPAESFTPVDRLCYVGARAVGALEYSPSQGPRPKKSSKLNIDALVKLASEVLSERKKVHGYFSKQKREAALQDILRVGTSAGGARAKAVIAWNADTNEVRSGQLAADRGFTYWILKFDGVAGNKDKELLDPQGYGLIEYAYHKMAVAAGIEMAECRVLSENGRNHFMTKRFDRTDEGKKLHMQSLGALGHYDFNQPGAYSYEQALETIRRFELPMATLEEQFRRMVFNIVARNQDDHVKNISFLMDKAGNWRLSPAYDVIYSYNPSGSFTGLHQMSLNGKRDEFEPDDFTACEKRFSMKRGRGRAILGEVQRVVRKWVSYAEEAGVNSADIKRIQKTHRTRILK